MIITVASGKGGTGKTTIAVNLALSLLGASDDPTVRGRKLIFADCDVEEPNAALFLNPLLRESQEVAFQIPEVDEETCTYCGRCAQVCEFHAIAVVGQRVIVFKELCHGCGSCTLECPVGAIHEVPYVIGKIERGRVGSMTFFQGTMNIGVATATPIVRQVKHWALDDVQGDFIAILDAPPGTSCPVVESLKNSDFALMVTEPTPFGLHDLKLAVQVARKELGMPVGVIINRDGIGDAGVEEFCAQEGVPILMRIPLDRRIAEAYSRGEPLISALPEYRERFLELYHRIQGEIDR
ncbi:MAG: ATP-binding protein [Anaerolineae bacterium]|nr:ATP-binding protein [Anaerolineae bacterium]